MMYFLFSFNIERSLEEQRYPLPAFLDIAVLDEFFTTKEQCRVPFFDVPSLSDEKLLGSWKAVMEVVASLISQTDERVFIFPSKGHLDLFHIIKQKCKIKTRTIGNAFLVQRKIYNENDSCLHDECISIDEMISAVKINADKQVSDDPDYILYWAPGKKLPNDQVVKQTSYIFMGDTRSMVFHEKESDCLRIVPKEHLRGLGWYPEKVGFIACSKCLKHLRLQAVAEKPKTNVSQRVLAGGRSKSEIMCEQIILLSEEYGMHAEIRGSIISITTIAGEWYFDYNDRPILLRHKSSEKRLDHHGKPRSKYHVQPNQFHAPLQVLAFIRNHERMAIKRSMDEESNECD